MIHVDAHLERFIDGFRPIDRKHRKKLFNRQWIFAANALNRRNQKFGVRLYYQTGKTGDVGSLLPDGQGAHESGLRIDDRTLQQFRLFLVADVRAQFRKFVEDVVIDLVVDHQSLFGSADGSVIEGLGEDDVDDSRAQVRGLFQIDRRVSRSHAQGWLARAIGGFDGARSTRGIDQPYIFVVHQVGVILQGMRFQAGEHTFGRAMLQRSLIHNLYGLGATMPGVRMRTEDDGVERLDGHDAFEEHRASGVGNRREREDDSDRLGDLHQIALREFTDDTHRPFILDVVVGELRGHHVLDDLVFHDADSGFLNREAGKILRVFEAGEDHRLDDTIHVLLGKLGEYSGRSSSLTNQSIQGGNPFFTEAIRGKWDLNSLLYCFARVHRYHRSISVGIHFR